MSFSLMRPFLWIFSRELINMTGNVSSIGLQSFSVWCSSDSTSAAWCLIPVRLTTSISILDNQGCHQARMLVAASRFSIQLRASWLVRFEKWVPWRDGPERQQGPYDSKAFLVSCVMFAQRLIETITNKQSIRHVSQISLEVVRLLFSYYKRFNQLYTCPVNAKVRVPAVRWAFPPTIFRPQTPRRIVPSRCDAGHFALSGWEELSSVQGSVQASGRDCRGQGKSVALKYYTPSVRHKSSRLFVS